MSNTVLYLKIEIKINRQVKDYNGSLENIKRSSTIVLELETR